MKKIFSNPTICFLVMAGFLFQSCAKKVDSKLTLQSDLSNKSIVQVYMAMVNANRNFVYVDGKQVNGASMISGSVFPATGLGFSAPVGLTGFLVRDTLPTATQIPLSFASNLAASKNYTVFVYDTLNSPKQKTVETTIEIPADTTARLRFANFTYHPMAPPAAVDIFSVKRNANIFTNVQVTDVTPFIPYASALNDTFYIRLTGTGTNLQNWSPTPAPGAFVNIQATLNPTAKRSYTLVFRGGYRASVTTNTTVRNLSVFINN